MTIVTYNSKFNLYRAIQVYIASTGYDEYICDCLLQNVSNGIESCVVSLEHDITASPDCQTGILEGQMVVSGDITEGMNALQDDQGMLPNEVHVSVTTEMGESDAVEDIGFGEGQLVETVSVDSGAQMVQAITLADGSTAYIQHPMKGEN